MILVCSDIFGETALLNHQAKAHLTHYAILSPYHCTIAAQHDQHAYQHFLAAGAMDAYRAKVQAYLETESVTGVLGFSAGAAATYAALCELPANKAKGIPFVGFYGGQIRHFTSSAPPGPCKLIFVEHEPHFSVASLLVELSQHAELALDCIKAEHGFMNPLSAGFNPELAEQYWPTAVAWLKQKQQQFDLNLE